jgi:single-strand DNA-binding protein
MSGETPISVVGNLVADPELQYTQAGIAVANLTVASTAQRFDKKSSEWVDEESLFLRGSVWREYAEHVAASLHKGDRVIVTGNLKSRSYETKEGEKRTSLEIDVQEIGPALRYATAAITRTASRTQATNQQSARAGQQRVEDGTDGWNTPGSYNDETPF